MSISLVMTLLEGQLLIYDWYTLIKFSISSDGLTKWENAYQKTDLSVSSSKKNRNEYL